MFPAFLGRLRKIHPTFRAGFILFGLLVLMFGDVLVGQRKLLSQPGTDLATQFAFWRWAGFAALKSGSVPLWNPYAFSGTPFQASFQTALFYPVNWVHLVLPPILALNWEMVINIFLAGLGMYLWAARSGRSFTASVLAGALLMFGMPYFLRISAGHMAPLGAMAWMPWIFAAVDEVFERPSVRAVLTGSVVCGLQLLAGHPQSAFTTGIAVGTYSLLRFVVASGEESLAVRIKRDLVRLGSLVLFFVGGGALAAIQLLPSLAITPETLRSHASFDFVSSFSFPPENVLTWIAPSFFGDIIHVEYWGRYYLWEMSLFFGIAGLLLMFCGFFVGKNLRWVWAGTLGVLFLLSLGGHTPVLRFLYDHVPPFDKFRSNSKFTIPAAVLLCFISAGGYDALEAIARGDQGQANAFFRRLCLGLALLAVSLTAAALTISGSSALWNRVLMFVSNTGEAYTTTEQFAAPAFIAQTEHAAAMSLGIAAFTVAAIAVSLWLVGRRPRFFAVFAVLAIVEVFAQAACVRASFPTASWYPREQEEFGKAQMKDNRILDLTGSNCWTLLKKDAAWGYDPFILRRYAEFMAVAQGFSADDASYGINITRLDPMLKMVRCDFVAIPADGQVHYGQAEPGLPHLLLVDKYRVLPGRDAILAALSYRKFDPTREVLLEERPALGETRAGQGTVKLLSQDDNSLEIEADLKSPQILLITDVYAKGWRAEPLDGSSQNNYQLLPADWTLRAVPLQAGHHHLRVVYKPVGWREGVWVSLLSLAFCGFLWGWTGREERRKNPEIGTDEQETETAG